MSGYNGYSKSNNAVAAEENGLMPLSHAIKALAQQVGCTQKQAREALKAVGPAEWHHTSKFYNQTDYYCLDTAAAWMAAADVRGYLEVHTKEIAGEWPLDSMPLDERSKAVNALFAQHAAACGCTATQMQNAYYNDYED